MMMNIFPVNFNTLEVNLYWKVQFDFYHSYKLIKALPSLLHDKSRTLSVKSSWMTTRGRCKAVHQTLKERSLDPMAAQQ